MIIQDYWAALPREKYKALLAPGALAGGERLCSALPGLMCSSHIFEAALHEKEAGGDYSICVQKAHSTAFVEALSAPIMAAWRKKNTTWERIYQFARQWEANSDFAAIKEIWLEFDCAELAQDIPAPCFFFDAEGMADDFDSMWDGPLAVLYDCTANKLTKENLKKVVGAQPQGALPYQLGIMFSRQAQGLRFFSGDLLVDQVGPFLQGAEFAYDEDLRRIDDFLAEIKSFIDGLYIVDFDVDEAGLSRKIGINFGLAGGVSLAQMAGYMLEKNLILADKLAGIDDWCMGNDVPPLTNNISHFKVPYQSEALGIKVYLRNHMPPRRRVPRW